MNRWQKIAIALIFFSFIGVYRHNFARLFRANKPPVLITEQARLDSLFTVARTRYSLAVKKINDGTYQPIDFARDVQSFMVLADSVRTKSFYCEQIKSFHESLGELYVISKINVQDPQKLSASLDFRRDLEEAHQQVRKERGVKVVDWQHIGHLLKSLYFKFLPFVILILLVKRWPVYHFNFNSFGDLAGLIVSLIFWPIGVFVYRPKNYFQQKLDSQVRQWKARVGDRGWRLALAYTTAFFVTVLSLIKVDPVKAAQVKNPKIICVASVSEIKLPVTEIIVLPKTPEPDPAKKDDLLEKIITIIKKILFDNFAILEIQPIQLAPVRKLLWLVIRPIRAVPRRICQKINSVRAPSAVVLVNVIHPRTTKQGVQNENENRHRIDFSRVLLSWRSQIFGLRAGAV